MPPVSSNSAQPGDSGDNLVARFRSATADLRRALAALVPGAQISVPLIAAAFAAVRRASQARYDAGSTKELAQNTTLAQALDEYHIVLREWHQQLPRVHGWLLAERARLMGRCIHTQSVSTWAETNAQTR